jgi:hypothetical protein
MREELHRLSEALDLKNNKILMHERSAAVMQTNYEAQINDLEEKILLLTRCIEDFQSRDIPHPEPKYTVGQVVMLLKHTYFDVDPADHRYRSDDRLVSISAFGWFRESPVVHKYSTQYRIDGGPVWIPEVWMRDLTDTEARRK